MELDEKVQDGRTPTSSHGSAESPVVAVGQPRVVPGTPTDPDVPRSVSRLFVYGFATYGETSAAIAVAGPTCVAPSYRSRWARSAVSQSQGF